ncbi:uncharacterized protein MONBRDRAFT_19326 [Monosiga brevicollis MX1]|uniref:DDB1- and CUL4-associated factor 13 n=1 Tax=Monosiga brevicollis TaxID=81824 RepID=A9UQN9_MONBE|nr:uncharacterized protein MONBRDRAFT_19326 [Monosiga brevicollis MX1]EDQ92632.1 predicted protein [Monosiga brevicollis MX1]|eukprot:XP_001742394.1 hypothetical protein [Monosiga brevicollis MX1]
MKIKTLSRDSRQYQRKTKHDIHPMQSNVDPNLHPLEAAREYKRAVNAVKMERMFAKPFVAGLDGHRDGVHCLAPHPKRLGVVFSGACDGELRAWNLAKQECIFARTLHRGFIRGIALTPLADKVITVGADKTIKVTKLAAERGHEDEEEAPLSIIGQNFFNDVSHHRFEDKFVTCGPTVELWSQLRSEPLRDLTWGVDTCNCVRFNPVETNVVATTADDRSITLYDIRASSPMRKVVLEMRSNRLCWNPMEAMNFTVANEDHNLYTFDMRKLKHALNVHKDHVSAVMDVSYSPTGQEFVSASYDCTLRIFSVRQGHSREIYHTQRMQRVYCTQWSGDNRYILSGSDETNVRLWKSTAWEHIGTKSSRQKANLQYQEKLKERFKHHPEVRRIQRQRHLPKAIKSAKNLKHIVEQSEKRKEDNRRAHSKKGSVPFKAERSKHVVAEEQ